MDAGSNWQLHWLEAAGDLRPWQRQIAADIEAARDAIAAVVAPPPLDILVQRLPGMVIPEIGVVGHTYRKRLVALTLDPDNGHFAASLRDGAVRRQIAHEVHHCLRMAGPGYGRTLGETLVSEGLAGHFVRRILGNAPEPWERAVEPDVLAANRPDGATLQSTKYDRSVWFFGTGCYPRWFGYTLGYAIVATWIGTTGEPDAARLVDVPAHAVLAATWSDLPKPILLPT